MIKYPNVRVVFDRKKTASKAKKAVVQIEIQAKGRKKYVTTGVRVFKGQWDLARGGVVGCMEMEELNKRVFAVKKKVDGYIAELQENEEAFDFDRFDEWMKRSEIKRSSFIDWLAERIETRPDIRETTRKTQRKLIGAMEEFGIIMSFNDLTRRNVFMFDEFLKRKGNKQTTVYSYHKFLKKYVHDALMLGLVKCDPYAGMKLDKGVSDGEKFLTDDELEKIAAARMPTESLNRVRDLFLLQCYTGMAYSDLMAADWGSVAEEHERKVLRGRRQKTGAEFFVVLTAKALEILERYGWHIPAISNQQYNMRLKVVAEAAGVSKPIASHWGRHTCGMHLLNHGVPMAVVAKVLGHKSIRTTESVYAKVLGSTVVKAFDGIE